MNILAFDIGGTQGRCCVAQCPAEGAVVALPQGPNKPECSPVVTLQRNPADNGPQWLDKLLAAGRGSAATASKLTAVAVSFGGPVRPDCKIQSVHVPGWEDVDLRRAMQEAFGLPVHIENDANAGAWGEFCFGAGRGCRHMAYLTVSTGIGGGVVLDGQLYRGAHGLAAEFGHIVLDGSAQAPQYAKGKRGVLEALASGPAIAREGRAALLKTGVTPPADFSARHVFDAAGEGRAWAVEVRDRAVEHLARGVAAVICAYDLERVIIGGGVALAGEALFAPLRAKVKGFLPTYLEDGVVVVQAALGDSAPLLGVIALCCDDASRRCQLRPGAP